MPCAHGRQRSRCKKCGGVGICGHGRVRSQCRECGGASICEHGRVRSVCKECGGASICGHGRRRDQCRECEGASFCEHGRRRSVCKECGGASFCEHGRRRDQCKECGGASFCEHGRRRDRCKECGGASFCEHGRRRHRCKEATCTRQRQQRQQLGAEFLRVAPPAPSSAPDAHAAVPPHPRGSKRPPPDDDIYHDENLDLALALSASQADMGISEDPRESRSRRRSAYTAHAPGCDSSCQGTSSASTGAAEDCDSEEECFGSCLGMSTSFVGEPRSRPDPTQPEGGWGFTACCRNKAHFGCLGRWLNPYDDGGRRKQAESSHGPVDLNLVCPFCREVLSRSSTRMMSE
jgi:hypothetical protein